MAPNFWADATPVVFLSFLAIVALKLLIASEERRKSELTRRLEALRGQP